jgi:hypothetical protein
MLSGPEALRSRLRCRLMVVCGHLARPEPAAGRKPPGTKDLMDSPDAAEYEGQVRRSQRERTGRTLKREKKFERPPQRIRAADVSPR